MNQHAAKPRITVLTVPGCPNAPVARRRLDTALNGRVAPVEWIEVSDEAEAAQWKMTGSPTILLDGADPFVAPGSQTGVSCRLYRHADGATDGAPTVAELSQALAAAGLPALTSTLGDGSP